jgi:hypothetical protein
MSKSSSEQIVWASGSENQGNSANTATIAAKRPPTRTLFGEALLLVLVPVARAPLAVGVD